MRTRKFLPPFLLLSLGCSLLAVPPAGGTASNAAPDSPAPTEQRTDGTWWTPEPGITWQWQLTGDAIDVSIDADVYDLDAFDAGAEVVASLHRAGRRVVCYISAGSWEDWRPDAAQFPEDAIGTAYEGWEGERWLDIRRIADLAPILEARMDLCRDKGFDGVEPDNVDGYQNETGFGLTAGDQLAFNRFLADAAHARGLAVGLKNDPEQAAALAADFDFALAEDCFDQGWCDMLQPFLRLGKPVLDAEYTDTGIALEDFCPPARTLGIRAILKRRELDAWRQACTA